jgi:hypothetical protein
MNFCYQCKYYGSASKTSGICRRHAPTPVLKTVNHDWTYWPVVEENDWCGEWYGKDNSGKQESSN